TGPLVSLLDDEHGQVQVSAIEALSHLKSAAALGALRAAAQSHDPDIERAALLGLSLSRDEASLPLLLAACAAPAPATRLVALSPAASFSAPEVIEALGNAAQDPDDAVRTAALGFLASRAQREASRRLIALLELSASPEALLAALATRAPGRVPELLSAL